MDISCFCQPSIRAPFFELPSSEGTDTWPRLSQSDALIQYMESWRSVPIWGTIRRESIVATGETRDHWHAPSIFFSRWMTVEIWLCLAFLGFAIFKLDYTAFLTILRSPQSCQWNTLLLKLTTTSFCYLLHPSGLNRIWDWLIMDQLCRCLKRMREIYMWWYVKTSKIYL